MYPHDLKSRLESKSRLPIPEFSGSYCRLLKNKHFIISEVKLKFLKVLKGYFVYSLDITVHFIIEQFTISQNLFFLFLTF